MARCTISRFCGLADLRETTEKLKKRILDHDQLRTISLSETHPSLQYPVNIAKHNMWMKFWDLALDHGVKGTKSALTALKLLSMSLFADRVCPVDDCDYVVPENTPLCDHLIHCHTDLSHRNTPSSLADIIISTRNDPNQFYEISRLSSVIQRQLPLNCLFMYLLIQHVLLHFHFSLPLPLWGI